MSHVWAILLMGAGVYALRLAGLALRDVALPPAWERALGLVPVSLLTALIVAALVGPSDLDPARLAPRLGGAAVGALVARRTGRMWACILGGMAAYWLLAWLAGSIGGVTGGAA